MTKYANKLPRSVPAEMVVLIYNVDPNRDFRNIRRRIYKLAEEYGELCRAYLSVTSPANAREASWDDVREEALDTFIIAVDIALTPGYDRSDIFGMCVRDPSRVPTSFLLETNIDQIADSFSTIGRHAIGVGLLEIIWASYRIATTQLVSTETDEIIAEQVWSILDRKLTKWRDQLTDGTVIT